MGKENTRAIVVIENSISDTELQEMDALGVRGIRINMNRGADDDLESIRLLAERIAPMNWSICFWMGPDKAVSMEQFLRSLPCPVVFDHRGHIPAAEGTNSRAFQVIAGMLRDNCAWVKLSGLYWDSREADFSDTIAVGKGYVEANPDRVIWGTDWPHPSHYSNLEPMPDDSLMLDALMPQAGTSENLYKILVTNPEKLFGFSSGI
jgi:predicted TIM-barrel fold metal-dependent hydrolase